MSFSQIEIKELKERIEHLEKYEDEADAEIYRMADVIEEQRKTNSEYKEENIEQQVAFFCLFFLSFNSFPFYKL